MKSMRNQTPPQTPVKKSRIKPALITISAILVLALTILIGQGLLFNPVYAEVSVDINPTIQLQLNRRLEVLSARALNKEAATLLKGNDLKGLGVEEAIFQWKELASKQYQVQTMLLASVMPANEEALRAILTRLEQTQNAGEEVKLQVQSKYIYSHDGEVVGQAKKNGLTVGRQMLLNQAKAQHQEFTAETMAKAPLEDVIPKLLKAKERNQTNMSRQSQASSDPSGTGEQYKEQFKAQNGTQDGSEAPNKEQNKATNGSTSGSSVGASTATGETNRETFREQNGTQFGPEEPNQEQNQATNGTTSSSGSSTPSGPSASSGTGPNGNGNTGGSGNGG